MSGAIELLARVEAAGGTAELRGDQVYLKAPEPLPDDLMAALRERKGEVMEILSITNLTLTEFERQGYALRIVTTWTDGSLWFVSTEAEATVLVSEGVLRGRIWTVSELRDLMSIPALDTAEIQSIQTIKDEFGGFLAEIKEVGVENETSPEIKKGKT